MRAFMHVPRNTFRRNFGVQGSRACESVGVPGGWGGRSDACMILEILWGPSFSRTGAYWRWVEAGGGEGGGKQFLPWTDAGRRRRLRVDRLVDGTAIRAGVGRCPPCDFSLLRASTLSIRGYCAFCPPLVLTHADIYDHLRVTGEAWPPAGLGGDAASSPPRGAPSFPGHDPLR